MNSLWKVLYFKVSIVYIALSSLVDSNNDSEAQWHGSVRIPCAV